MITSVTQRWRDQRGSYRPAGEVIRPAEFEVAAIADDATAKAFVTRHHYSRRYPAARFRFGLYRRSELVGVAVLPDGSVFEERAASKIRALDSRWRSAAAPLLEAGAPPVDTDDPAGWLERSLQLVARPFRHPGNHRYVFALDRRARRHLPPGLPYPKFTGGPIG